VKFVSAYGTWLEKYGFRSNADAKLKVVSHEMPVFWPMGFIICGEYLDWFRIDVIDLGLPPRHGRNSGSLWRKQTEDYPTASITGETMECLEIIEWEKGNSRTH
jgi:hypothetical protein